MLVHTCDPSPREVEARQPCKVEVSVDYLVRPVFRKEKKNQQNMFFRISVKKKKTI